MKAALEGLKALGPARLAAMAAVALGMLGLLAFLALRGGSEQMAHDFVSPGIRCATLRVCFAASSRRAMSFRKIFGAAHFF